MAILAGEETSSMQTSSPCGDLSYSLRRYFVDSFFTREIQQLRPDCSILDLGGTSIGKRGVFNIEEHGHRVMYVNISSRKKPTILADAAALPFRENSFDVIVCSEVLEHVYDYRSLLEESLRVLKPQGLLLATVPFMYPQHPDPMDYFRYTEQFFASHLTSLGFCSVATERQGGFWSVFVDMIRAIAYEGQERPGVRRLLIRYLPVRFVVARLKQMALQWDARAHAYRTVYCNGVTTGFAVKASKLQVS